MVEGVNQKLERVDDTYVVLDRVMNMIGDEREKIDTEIDKLSLKTDADIKQIYEE